MIDRDNCPMCADGEVQRSEGRLDQSGLTFLPTWVWTCNACGYVRYEAALKTHWKPTYPSDENRTEDNDHVARVAA